MLLDVTQDIQWTYQQVRISRETISLKNINVANENDSNRFRNFISTTYGYLVKFKYGCFV